MNTRAHIYIIVTKTQIHLCASHSHPGDHTDQLSSKPDPWTSSPSSTWERVEMNVLQLHARFIEAKTLRVGPAICVLTSLEDDGLKTENRTAVREPWELTSGTQEFPAQTLACALAQPRLPPAVTAPPRRPERPRASPAVPASPRAASPQTQPSSGTISFPLLLLPNLSGIELIKFRGRNGSHPLFHRN